MIGFDLDGVFLPDIATASGTPWFLGDEVKPPKATLKPEGEYAIITGRPSCDRKHTLEWIMKELGENPPTILHHANQDFETGAEYKAAVLGSSPEISHFIESCPKQTETIRKLLPGRHVASIEEIVHLGIKTWIEQTTKKDTLNTSS